MTTPSQPQQLPAGLMEALQQQSNRERPQSRLLSALEGGLSDVILTEDTGTKTNAFDLMCPRSECSSVILKKDVAKHSEREAVQMEPEDHHPHPLLPASTSPGQKTSFWLVTPSPMTFENIGFTRPVESVPLSSSGKKLKLLICAECELGPLGWCEEGGTEFWLSCDRVGYSH